MLESDKNKSLADLQPLLSVVDVLVLVGKCATIPTLCNKNNVSTIFFFFFIEVFLWMAVS